MGVSDKGSLEVPTVTDEKPNRFPRSFFIITLGPLVGAAVMSLIMTAVARAWENGQDLSSVLLGFALYLSFGYMAGILPAIGSALLWRFCVPNHWSPVRRAVAAVLIGGLCGALLVWPFMSLFVAFIPFGWSFAALSGLCGAIALLATALPWSERA